MKLRFPTLALALIGMTIAGFVAGRVSSTASKKDDAAAVSNDGPGGRASQAGRSSAAERDAGRKDSRNPRGARKESRADRMARLEGIVRNGNALDRQRAFLAWIDQLSPGDFETAMEQLQTVGLGPNRQAEQAMLLSAWAKLNPLAAMDYASAHANDPSLAQSVLGAWASADPDAAIQWAQSHHDGDDANPYLAGIIQTLGATDPARATGLLTGMPRSRERAEALEALLPHLLAQGPEATQKWIAALTDQSLRDGAVTRAAQGMAALDPAATVAWLAANPTPDSQFSLSTVYGTWAAKDPAAAERSLASQASGGPRGHALGGIVPQLALDDPTAAVALMDRYPNDLNEGTIHRFIWRSFDSNPSVAVEQIARIPDEERRNITYNNLISSWLRKDAAAANAWLQTHPLPPAVRERLNLR